MDDKDFSHQILSYKLWQNYDKCSKFLWNVWKYILKKILQQIINNTFLSLYRWQKFSLVIFVITMDIFLNKMHDKIFFIGAGADQFYVQIFKNDLLLYMTKFSFKHNFYWKCSFMSCGWWHNLFVNRIYFI